MASGCVGEFADPSRALARPESTSVVYPTEINRPTTLGVVDTERVDINGTPVGVSCVTCHGPTPETSWAGREGGTFHTGLEVVHGDLSCESCHDAVDKTRLHLSDNSPVDMLDAMTLCAQCHGPQFRDYSRGSHGGMTGYWDTTKGPRERNHCVECHAPHAPAVPRVSPAPPPIDRGVHE